MCQSASLRRNERKARRLRGAAAAWHRRLHDERESCALSTHSRGYIPLLLSYPRTTHARSTRFARTCIHACTGIACLSLPTRRKLARMHSAPYHSTPLHSSAPARVARFSRAAQHHGYVRKLYETRGSSLDPRESISPYDARPRDESAIPPPGKFWRGKKETTRNERTNRNTYGPNKFHLRKRTQERKFL